MRTPLHKISLSPPSHTHAQTYHHLMSLHLSPPNAPRFPPRALTTPSYSIATIPKSSSLSTDRFIPSRKLSSMPTMFACENHTQNPTVMSAASVIDSYERHVLSLKAYSNRFRYSKKDQEPQNIFKPDQLADLTLMAEKKRNYPKIPNKILDAPNLQDDFYLSLLDWTPSNALLVGLHRVAYLWSADTGKVDRLCQLAEGVSSVCSAPKDLQVAVGSKTGSLLVIDIVKSKTICQFNSKSKERIGVLSWSSTQLASGSRDKEIRLFDPRVKGKVGKLMYHKQQVCGLKWSPNIPQLASGGNDNFVCLWDSRCHRPLFVLRDHKAAVKSLDWSPHRHGLLVSGGGTKDKSLKLWNTLEGKCELSVNTGSQVCSVLFSKNTREIVSTHGYSQNQILIWDSRTLENTGSLTGHCSRVLFMALNAQGDTIVTGAGGKDETLRFWSLFPQSSTDVRSSELDQDYCCIH